MLRLVVEARFVVVVVVGQIVHGSLCVISMRWLLHESIKHFHHEGHEEHEVRNFNHPIASCRSLIFVMRLEIPPDEYWVLSRRARRVRREKALSRFPPQLRQCTRAPFFSSCT